MESTAPNSAAQAVFDPAAWAAQHSTAAIAIAAVCLWISFALILRMWILHRKAPLLRKLAWSLILLIPLAGWIAYGACFHPLASNDTECPTDNSWE